MEVATTGRYEAVLYYTCAAEDAGAVVELSFNGSTIEGKAEAHDPPLRGAELDRVESEVAALINHAVEAARAAPPPDSEALLRDVYVSY